MSQKPVRAGVKAIEALAHQRASMLALLNGHETPLSLHRYGCGGSRAGEGVEHPIAWLGGELNAAPHQFFRLFRVTKAHPALFVEINGAQVGPQITQGLLEMIG